MRVSHFVSGLVYFGTLGFCFHSTSACAQLAWKEKSIVLSLTPDSDQAKASFHFTNGGKEPVTIKEVKSSCDCTVTTLAKKTYQPGESGSVEVAMKKSGRRGVQRNTIHVFTDHALEPNADLIWTVNVSEWLTISPPFALWKRNDSASSREINLTFSSPEVSLLSVRCSPDSFKVQQIEKGDKTVLQFIPRSTESATRSVVEILVKLPDGKTRQYQAYAVVK